MERYEDSLDYFDWAIKIDPEDLENWHDKWRVIHGLKKYDEVLKLFDKALDPEYKEVSCAKGALLEILKKRMESKKYFKKITGDKSTFESTGNTQSILAGNS